MEKLNLNPSPYVEPVPEQTAIDYAIAITKVSALAFPFLGSGVALFDLLTGPIRGKRISSWYEHIRLHLNDLHQKVDRLTPESLANNEAFFSAFAQATQSAFKTHQKEKLAALRNAVLNVALGREPDANRQQQFLALLDRFSEDHLAVLKFLNDPTGFFQLRDQPLPRLDDVRTKMLVNTLVTEAFPTMKKVAGDASATSFQFVEMILGDLVSAHLVTFERNQDTWDVPAFAIRPGGGPIGKMTKHLAEDFLGFISEPDLEKKEG